MIGPTRLLSLFPVPGGWNGFLSDWGSSLTAVCVYADETDLLPSASTSTSNWVSRSVLCFPLKKKKLENWSADR